MKLPSTEDLQAEGEAIAKELGCYYNGPWIYRDKFIGHTLTDTEVTGTTFVCKNLEDCRKRLEYHRDAFAAERAPTTRKLTAEMVKKFREEEWLPPMPKTIPDIWKETYGENAVLKTSDRWDNIVKHLGYKSYWVDPSIKAALSEVLKTDRDLVQESQRRLREVKIIPDSKLSATPKASIELGREIVRQNEGNGLVKVHAAIIPPASDRVRTAGMYATRLWEIYINLDQLNHGKQMIDAIIHELSHHQSGTEDLEEAHGSMMSKLASDIVEQTNGGVYDKYLRNPSFVW